MNGRIEQQQKVKDRTLSKLSNAPEIVQNYYYRLTQSRSEVTKERYISQVLTFINFIGGEENLKNTDTNTLARYQDWMKQNYLLKSGKELEALTICNKMSCLSTFFKFCVQERILERNPMDQYQFPIIPEKDIVVVSLDDTEIEQLMETIDNGIGSAYAKVRQAKWRVRDKTIIHVALALGLRVEALVEINVSDIDFYNAQLHVIEKRERHRTFYLGHETIKQLKHWLKERQALVGDGDIDALFITKYKGEYKRITKRTVQKMVEKYTANIDKKITPHKLRSTAGEKLYNETGNIYLVADLLGHSNVTTSKRYASNTEKSKREMAQKMASFASTER